MYRLFLNQAIPHDGLFFSDITAYIQEIMGTNELYDFPYPIMFKTAELFTKFCDSPHMAMAITIAFYNSLAIIITKVFITYISKARVLSTLATFGLFFLSMIYSDAIDKKVCGYHYLGVFSPNPWHNGTYLSARPFMILAFILGVITLCKYEEDFKDKKDAKAYVVYLLYAFVLLAVTMTKPSYTIIHLFAVAFIMLYRFLKSKFGNFKQSILYAVCFVPTLVDLLYQFSGVFIGKSARGEQNGVGIQLFRVWNQYTNNFVLSIILAGAFPLIVLLFHLKEIKTNEYYRFGWQLYLSGILTSVVFYEKGFREGHFNFAWGYMCGLFIAYLVSVIVVIKDIKRLIVERGVGLYIKLAPVVLQIFIFMIHVYMGIRYFIYLCKGGIYY